MIKSRYLLVGIDQESLAMSAGLQSREAGKRSANWQIKVFNA